MATTLCPTKMCDLYEVLAWQMWSNFNFFFQFCKKSTQQMLSPYLKSVVTLSCKIRMYNFFTLVAKFFFTRWHSKTF